jgi:hypothetical protein
MNRRNLNYKVKDKLPCQICNPIEPCSKGSICPECFKWLEEACNGNRS